MTRPSTPATSPAPSPALFRSAEEKTALEARNALEQYDEAMRLVAAAQGVLALTPATLLHLQRLAIKDIYTCAGNFRTFPIQINGSIHAPPPADEVPGLVEQMCDYANAARGRSPIHVAAYLMWRLNWIHPFGGGNGRTSRMTSYMALCIRLNCVLPGRPTIAEQIAANRMPYYEALDLADAAWKEDQRIDVSAMETLLEAMLATQLIQVHNAATGSP